MKGSLQWMLLIMSCLSLAGLGLSGFLVSRAQNYRQKRDARLAMVVTPHVRTQRLEVSAFTRAAKPKDQSLIGISARVFGGRLGRRRAAGGGAHLPLGMRARSSAVKDEGVSTAPCTILAIVPSPSTNTA